MSPSLDVNGFKLRNFDPKPRGDLVPRWKRSWISRETAAIAGLQGGCASDRLVEDGSVSLGQRRPDRCCRENCKELGWEHHLAQPQVREVLVPPIITAARAHEPLFVTFARSWKKWKGNNPESQEDSFRRKKYVFFPPHPLQCK